MKEILIPLNFTTTPVLYDTKQSFSASDEESGVLTFTTPANVTGTVASLTLRNASDNANRQTILVERLDINSSPFSYIIVKPLPFGNYEGEITLKKGTQIVASAVFLFGVNSSLSASVLPKLVEAYSLDALVEEVETEVSNLKDAYTLTVSETVKGVNRTDSTVQASENVRYLNEATRKANELLRISQEAARVVAEGARVTEFNTLVDTAVIEQVVTQEVAEKYQELEALNSPEMVSVRQQLADITSPDIATIITLPQTTKPEKSGLQENGNKLAIKNTNGFYQVIQKTNKDYLIHDLKTNVGGSGTSDTGGSWQLLRLTRSKPVPACYVYCDYDTVTGTTFTYAAEGDYNSVESELFKFYAPVAINEYKSNKAANAGLKCVPAKSADGTAKYTFNFKVTKVAKANILILATTAGSPTNEIYVNGKLVKTFDGSSTSVGEYRVIEFDVPVKYANDVITVEVVNKAIDQYLYLVCANFKELKDYNGEWITKYKAFIDTAAFIDSTGANDYAMFDNSTQKFVGSYHGGETLLEGKMTWVSSDRFDIETRKGETTITNSILNGSFCVLKDFYIEQRTQLSTLGVMISRFDFTIDGSINMMFSWDGDVTSDNFYTVLTCTHPNFTRIRYPQYKELQATENMDYLLPQVTGLVSQFDPVNLLKLDTRFDRFNSAYSAKDVWVKSLSTSYRKVYYGFVNKTNRIQKITWAKSLDFTRA